MQISNGNLNRTNIMVLPNSNGVVTGSSQATAAAPAGMDLADQFLQANLGGTYASLFPGSVYSAPAASAAPAPAPAPAPTNSTGSGSAPSGTDPKSDTSATGLLGDLEKLIGDGVGMLENFADGLVSKVGDSVTSMADGLVSKIGGAAESFADGLVSKALQGLESLPLIGGLIKDFEPTLEKAADGLVHDLVGGVEKSVDGLISKGVSALESGADGLIKDIGGGIEGWLDGQVKNIGGLLGGIFG